MKLGVSLPVAGPWATPDNQVLVAERAEALGYASLWTLQRILYPVDPANDYPPQPGQPWPIAFASVVDPITTLAYVAAHTRRVRLGTAVLNAPFYHPIMLAKQVATLDRVSGGRLAVGLGLGWSRDEYESVGVPYERRGARMDEFVGCLKAILAEDVVSFSGEFYRVPASRVDPKPVQRPHPPILIGGYGPPAIRRTAAMGDGYVGGNMALDRVAPLIASLADEARAHGRDPDTLEVVARGTVKLHDTPQGDARRPLFGSLEEIRADIDAYRRAGLTELFLELNLDPMVCAPDVPPDEGLRRALHVIEAFAPAG